MVLASKTTEVKYIQKGNKGAKLRMRDWDVNVKYLSGEKDELFYDVVLYKSKLYLCLVSHTSISGVNDPITSVSQQKGFWEIAQEWVLLQQNYYLLKK